jgi:hypothetical protein
LCGEEIGWKFVRIFPTLGSVRSEKTHFRFFTPPGSAGRTAVGLRKARGRRSGEGYGRVSSTAELPNLFAFKAAISFLNIRIMHYEAGGVEFSAIAT